jgi:hypothetical protein
MRSEMTCLSPLDEIPHHGIAATIRNTSPDLISPTASDVAPKMPLSRVTADAMPYMIDIMIYFYYKRAALHRLVTANQTAFLTCRPLQNFPTEWLGRDAETVAAEWSGSWPG